jgi:hypothetical protein
MKLIRRQILAAALWLLKKGHRYFQHAYKHGDSQYEAGKAAWETRQWIKEIETQLSKS